MNFVAAKIPEKWREVGIGLGLDTTDIKHIEADVLHTSPLPATLLCLTHGRTKALNSTWDTLLIVLRSPLVDASNLANTIEGQLS